MIELRFVGGTLEVRGLDQAGAPEALAWDARSACHRAPAQDYADVVRALMKAGHTLDDRARAYLELSGQMRVHRVPRPYQEEALAAWEKARGRGVVVLPTGAGKTQVALMAIAAKKRSALVIAPTLDLVRQWYDALRETFGEPVGVLGGGEHQIEALTAATYDSAHLHMEHLGARFGLVVFDECHHLPSPSYALAARFSLAPYRLGLSATPERTDGKDGDLTALIGPIVYRKEVGDLAGEYLAEYDTETLIVELSPELRAEYEAERAVYVGFLRRQGLRMNRPDAFTRFIQVASRSGEGRRALACYRRQREIALAAPAKLDHAERLLDHHRGEQAILFTQDNAMAYRAARRLLIPVITHQTKVRERSEILEGFKQGRYGAIATSKVLNEGVDVPAAQVAIVVSGSGSVREHVQRLGRVLRKQEGKRAVMYELITGGTGETFTSERRREHDAYR